MNQDYRSTLIAVAEDCPARTARVPDPGKPTVAAFQHAMLAEAPGRFRQADVLFATHLRGRSLTPAQAAAEREAFFAKGRACLRASPLAKTHGFGFLFDEAGRITLLPVESEAYAKALADPALAQLKAMRSARAR